jgi:hypothetical protein
VAIGCDMPFFAGRLDGIAPVLLKSLSHCM